MAKKRRNRAYMSWYDYAAIFLVPALFFVGIIRIFRTHSQYAAEPPRPFNIILIVTDDNTIQFINEYYTGYIHTPNLNLLGSRGLTYRNCFTENSNPSSALATILTGCYSHEHGIMRSEDKVINPVLTTIPAELQKAGFQTALFGKWSFNSLPEGFDKWEILSGDGDYYNPAFIDMDGDTVVESGYVTSLITNKSLKWLEKERDPSKPFFLMINHKVAGDNWMPDLDYLHMYEDETFRLPDSFYDDFEGRDIARGLKMRISDPDQVDMLYDLKLPGFESKFRSEYEAGVARMDGIQRAVWDKFYDSVAQSLDSLNLSGRELAEWKYQRLVRDYAKVMKNLDDNLYRLRKYFYSDVIIIFTSSRGAFVGEHGWMGSGSMYEPSFHVPLIIQGPADYLYYYSPGEKRYYLKEPLCYTGAVKVPVQHVDLAPTICDLAGITIPEQMKGISLMPYMKGFPPDEPRCFSYFHSYDLKPENGIYPHYGIRDYRHKLIHFYGKKDIWELYDLYEDPDEMHNLYGKEGTEDITRELKDELQKHQESRVQKGGELFVGMK